MDSTAEDDLTVEAFYDRRGVNTAHAIHAATFLSGLSEAEWTDLRALATRSRKSDDPKLLCGDCTKPIYARESFRGRRHFYHFAGDHSDCQWSGAVGKHIHSIDAYKFHGQQEGEEHRTLSRYVAEILALDSSTRDAGVIPRRYTKHLNNRAYPDVFAEQWRGSPAAFEIQLSTTHMQVITRREDFYRDAGIRLIWIVGYHDRGWARRAFKDIYMRNDGQILGMDGEVVEVARKAGEPRFRLYRLLPGSANERFEPKWRSKIVSPDEINWGNPGDRPRSVKHSYDAYLNEKVEKDSLLSELRRDFYDALAVQDETRARRNWDAGVGVVGGWHWNKLPSPHDTIRAFGVLASLRTGRLYVHSEIPLTELPNLVNSTLLEPKERRLWTHAFELLCSSMGMHELLSKPSIIRKCQRNKSEMQADLPIDLIVGPVFNVFFPEGAFYRLTLE